MLGFIAQATSEEIKVDGIEIAEANWFHYKQLPEKSLHQASLLVP